MLKCYKIIRKIQIQFKYIRSMRNCLDKLNRKRKELESKIVRKNMWK